MKTIKLFLLRLFTREISKVNSEGSSFKCTKSTSFTSNFMI